MLGFGTAAAYTGFRIARRSSGPRQRLLRRPGDRAVRPGVQEQPDQLPRPPQASRAPAPADDPVAGGEGGRRPLADRGRLGRQPPGGAPHLVRPDGRDHGDLHLLRPRPQEHDRLGEAGVPGRRRPPDQHPVRRDQAGRRPRADRGRRRPPVPFSVETKGVRPEKVILHYSTTAATSTSPRSSPRARTSSSTPGRPASGTSSRTSTTT